MRRWRYVGRCWQYLGCLVGHPLCKGRGLLVSVLLPTTVSLMESFWKESHMLAFLLNFQPFVCSNFLSFSLSLCSCPQQSSLLHVRKPHDSAFAQFPKFCLLQFSISFFLCVLAHNSPASCKEARWWHFRSVLKILSAPTLCISPFLCALAHNSLIMESFC